MIEGLTSLSIGEKTNRLSGSKFGLPPSFPSHSYASKWVEEGPAVTEARQDEYLHSANVKAKGWEVWLYDPRSEKTIEADDKKPAKLVPYTRAVGKRVYILMYRPKALQNAVRRIYADESRSRTGQVLSGEINPVGSQEDPHGLVTNHDLNRYGGQEDDPGSEYLRPSANSKPTRLHEANELQLQ